MYQAIVFLPLLGAIIAGLIAVVGARRDHAGGEPSDDHEHGHAHGAHDHAHDDHGHDAHGHGDHAAALGSRPAELITSGFLVIAALLSWIAFFTVGFGEDEVVRIQVMPWFTSGTLSVDWALRIDTLTVVMLVVVTTVSTLVHIYSIGYMAHDHDRPRFFAYLSLFTFAMLALVTDWGIRLDRLTAIMLIVVTTVSSLVHLYSVGYMDHDANFREGEVYKPRFFAYLSFFTFAMLALVTADNLVQMFFGWEGVGLFSYLLIGFWYTKPEANAAAIKAFVVNRVGDFGFALGIFGLFAVFHTVNLDQIFDAAPAMARKARPRKPVHMARRRSTSWAMRWTSRRR